MTQEFSGGTAPAGSSPWLTPRIDDQGTPGTVQLKVETTNLTGSEKVSGLYLNIDPSIDPADLSFSAPTKTGIFADPVISLSTDTFKADGDGKYDILLTFSTSSGSEFGAGEEVEYTITGLGSAAGLIAADFVFLSAPAGGHGPFYAAAHVQGIGAGLSGWISPDPGLDPFSNPVPEPNGIILFTLGLAIAERIRRRIS
ncbi:MAG: hypothetical protein KDA57_20495 [Planctomycetales bacterium]|nr:hypothetical protein [Planctomycetales bacterium]